MANRLSYGDLLKYMEIVLDMEKNVYIELQSWQQLQGQINCLGIAKNYEAPVKRQMRIGDFFSFSKSLGWSITSLAFFLFALFIITIFIFPFHLDEKDFLTNILNFFDFLLSHLLLFFIGSFAITVIIGIIIGIKNKTNSDKIYDNELNNYNSNISNDKSRVNKELQNKQYLQAQCDTLAQMWRTSKDKLEKIYSYDILEEKYRNIVAVSSIYEYLKYGRTESLQRKGSDEGAYNIFESEVRLNKIITNTDIIIQKLDVVIENQRELANTMKNAQNSINNLVTSTNNMSAKLESGINRLNTSAELSNYQQQQTNNELRYMNMMNTLHFYK